MVETALDFLIGNLKELLLYNANLISTAKVHVESLYNDLGLLKAFVKESSERRSTDVVVEELVKEIRIEVYKVEDVIDTYDTEAFIQKTRSGFAKFTGFADYLSKLRNVRKEIREIRKRVKDIHGNKQFLGDFSNRTEETITRSLPSVEQENVVGFDEESKRVVGWLNSKTEALEVISIMGMGGLGKITSTITRSLQVSRSFLGLCFTSF
ncbi:putative virus X resistance protein-like, coiled-coil [Helianthus annuus]|uniref:Virus X resistance protein-like, coiled-coil n=1 Tax=Helianthus annuus TaxID=4232 RepID=A0A251S055_HELAN|nr:putative virus X resistance protein-like, coiled-coil [Helianthus annuus]KAJ0443235.1 putative virus X resistance protein-like, coiled-coil [Helianthus annuus]KAJ0460800.1 putative virus X resistance protein-like, coiled-coil [Helianthus annuus]KAJ0641220.1 putative virus X resistance protein-like, coiled-coil [Helianthus annuus]KAJ0645131.1 putative virus X resistance protein-like, coiled-coil [Helianthus annuus]